ncbi:MAG: prolipoprotein diacylglyceryl transferase [Chloroflexi bacterium]|nr:prolipoprotein diacylglyceryl transferase [Chloroflexota bacterium]
MLPLLQVGPVSVATHDLFTVLALGIGFAIYYRELRRRSMLGPRIVLITLAGLVGGILGSRVLLAWEHLDWYAPALAGHPITWVIENSGKSIIGAVFAAYLTMVVAKRILGYTRSTGDCYAFALPIAIAVGRIGCFLSELPLGTPTDLPWGVTVSPEAAAAFGSCPGCDLPMHPTMLYEIAFNVLAVGVMLRLRSRLAIQGDLVKSYLLAAGTFRFLVEFIRTSPPQLAGLTAPQLVLIPMLAYLVIHFVRERRAGLDRPPQPLGALAGAGT